MARNLSIGFFFAVGENSPEFSAVNGQFLLALQRVKSPGEPTSRESKVARRRFLRPRPLEMEN